MKIETKFEVGSSVVFLSGDCILRRRVTRIEIEASKQIDPQGEKVSVLIKYIFPDVDSHGGYNPFCKYENEVAATKEELAAQLKEH